MAAQKRTKIQRERDLEEIAQLYLRGWTQAAISDHISGNRAYTITQRTVSRDIKTIQQRWMESSVRDFDDMRAQELAKIDELERTYWDAWARSCEDAEEERIEGRVKSGKPEGSQKLVTTRRGRLGNATYLAGVERCIEKRCKLLGLNAPEKVAPTNPAGDESWSGDVISFVVHE